MMLLDLLYDGLDFKNGSLHSASDTPSSCRNRSDWIEKGEWISSAKKVGADKIFFVENNPVVVFLKCEDGLEEKIKAFNRAWCLARPRLLFLASPGEITLYDLAQKPVDINNKKDRNKLTKLVNLNNLQDLSNVAQKLQAFHRDNIESGRVFADRRFGDLKNRADQALIRDLKTVRRELSDAGLSGENIQFAHALIGRSIFIRYLEDREILTEDYFLNVARQKAGWTDLLRSPVNRSGIDFSGHKTFYPRILVNKDFTYALFKKLARDFNGDMFPDVDGEEKTIDQKHLTLMQGLLYGDVGIQKKLFFHSYRFDIVPLDLISSIYEEFYHRATEDEEKKKKARMDGAYYTPSVLAEFVLSRTLTPDVLATNPRVMDPACGSGIFLVEAFRRIVRYRWHKNKKPLTFDELKEILKKQIAGIEVNIEAARVAAFSLYLSMLHYLDPPAIDRQIKMGNRLPNLVASISNSPNHFHCILPANAFDIERIESNAIWEKCFGKASADVIVGNPPWGAPVKEADKEAKDRHKILLGWCNSNNKSISNKEASQAFLWRAMDFLRDGGKAGMLVSAGVLFKNSSNAQNFREHWMKSVCIEEVFNFAHVRKFFFKGISPFIAICVVKGLQKDYPVTYWSAKQISFFKKNQAILFSKYDIHVLREQNLTRSKLWKSLWFGQSSDYTFIKKLYQFTPISAIVDYNKSGRGYQTYTDKHDGDKLGVKKTVKKIDNRYDLIELLPPPHKVYNLGPTDSYKGERLLINEGITEKGETQGTIIARFENEPFSFFRSIYGIKLISKAEHTYKLLLGILWSSLSRYYFFTTSANWGLWHHKILFDELTHFPIVSDKNNLAATIVISIVDELRNYHPSKRDIINPAGVPEEEIEEKRRILEDKLDEAVFELYNFDEKEKDLIRDCCEVTIPFFYKPFDSIGAMPAIENGDLSWLKKYSDIFCRRWNAYLGEDEGMRAEVHVGAHGTMVALEFYPADSDDPREFKIKDNSWEYILEQIGEALPQPMGTSQIVLDGLVHIVSDSGIIIIKRNEKRFWTRSLAREDADATLCKRMVETRPEWNKG
ncbi:MAG: N-6 DNA methylase [Desulfobacteraceae bacterium]|jgi:hypothetical protein|nr:N-6 DNA methylase [Desulfobacteraceae bacterium]